jgi:hypothetical protein
MFTLTYVDLEYETNISISEFELIVLLIDSFTFISARYTIKITKHQ